MKKNAVAAMFLILFVSFRPVSSAQAYIYNTYNYNKNSIYIKSTFPVFDKNNNTHLNKIIESRLFYLHLNDMKKRYFKNVHAFLTHLTQLKKTEKIRGYICYSKAKVVHFNKKVLSVEYKTYTMPLGYANGINHTYAILVDLKTHEILKITDLFPKNKIKLFSKICLSMFISQMKSSGLIRSIKPSLIKHFYLPKNYIITKTGIKFVFAQYEIGPRSIGLPSFNVNINALKSFIRPEYKALIWP